jgi:hypothetical protein
MSLDRLWQLAQSKLAAECLRADHKLLLVLHHASLLHNLNNYYLGNETMQPRRELATSKVKVGGRDASSNQLNTMSEKLRSSCARSYAVLQLTSNAKR